MIIYLTIIAILIKIAAFVREAVMAYYYGTSYVADCYVIATTIPMMIFGCINAISVGYIPLYTKIRKNNDKSQAIQFTNNVITWTVFVSLIGLGLAMLSRDIIVYIFAANFNEKATQLVKTFLQISFIVVLIQPLFQLLMSYLDCNEKFIASNLPSLCMSFIQVIFIYISVAYQTELLIWGYLSSHIAVLLFVYFNARKYEYKYHFIFQWNDSIKQIYKNVFPIFLSNTIGQINQFVDKSFAATLPIGSIAALNYANTTKNLIYALITASFITVSYPRISAQIAAKNLEEAKIIFLNTTNIFILLLVPITTGAICLSKEIVSFIYQQGNFDIMSTEITSGAFSMYALGLLFISLRELIVRFFYSLGKNTTPMYVSCITVTCNILMNFIFIKVWKLPGLALATSISAIISILIYAALLFMVVGDWGIKKQLKLLTKSIFSSLIMFYILSLLKKEISIGNGKEILFIKIIIITLIGALIYGSIMAILYIKILLKRYKEKK